MDFLEVIKGFLSNYEKLVGVLEFLFFAILSLLLYKKTGNINFIKGVVQDMKYRKENYQDKEKVKGQTFSNLKPIKRLNKATGLLEDTGEFVDIDELTVSSLPTILDNILEKFMPSAVEQSEMVVERDEIRSDLDFMQDAFLCAEEYKTKYSLPESYSPSEVFEYVKKQADKLNDDILKAQTVVKKVEEIKKEVTDNEEEVIEKSE